jgi:hypothetical protein
MVDNQHKKITGYRDLTEFEIRMMNLVKTADREVAELWLQVRDDVTGVERRWLAVARAHFQEGFSALVRAIARPEDPYER